MPTNSHPSSLLHAPWDDPPSHTASHPSSVSFLCSIFLVQSLTGLFQGQHISSTSSCTLLPAPEAVLVQTPTAQAQKPWATSAHSCLLLPTHLLPLLPCLHGAHHWLPTAYSTTSKSTAYDRRLFPSDRSSLTILLLTAFLHTCFPLAYEFSNMPDHTTYLDHLLKIQTPRSYPRLTSAKPARDLWDKLKAKKEGALGSRWVEARGRRAGEN